MGEFDFDPSALEAEFKAEVNEHIQTIEKALLEASEAGNLDANHIHVVFRAAHTIKGSARMMDNITISEVGHKMEDLLGQVRAGKRPLDADMINLLLRGCDILRQLLADQEAIPSGNVQALIQEMEQMRDSGGRQAIAMPSIPAVTMPTPPTAEPNGPSAQPNSLPAKPASSPVDATNITHAPTQLQLDNAVRISTHTLATIIEQSNDLLIEFKALHSEFTRIASHFANIATSDHGDAGTKAIHAGEQTKAKTNTHQLEQRFHRIDQKFNSLHKVLLKQNLLPLSTLTLGIQHNIYSLAQELHKQVAFTVEGEGTRIDWQLMQTFWDITLHLARNSIDHGIEPPEERIANGKPATGQIKMSIWLQGDQVAVTFSDDGRGIDLEKVKAKAVQLKLISEQQAKTIGQEETLQLLFQPGFSTAPLITDVSGRGVGLDVVRDLVWKLNGNLSITTEPGQGTQIHLLFPMTLATTQAVLFRIGNVVHALPDSTVEGIIDLMQATIYHNIQEEQVINWGDHIIPLRNLAQILYPRQQHYRQAPLEALVVQQEGKRIAFAVDVITDIRRLIVKPLPSIMNALPWSNAYVLNEQGNIIFLLNSTYLLAQSRPTIDISSVGAEKEEAPRTILVVDDSRTTREIEHTMLVASGYRVITAADGQEAWKALQDHPEIKLIVTDIEMPKMDGFTLTKKIRATKQWTNLPVIIVTALDKPAERQHGLQVGAQAYITKQGFQKGNLLQTIRRLIS